MSGQLGTDLFFVITGCRLRRAKVSYHRTLEGQGSDAGMHIVVGTLVRCVR